MLNRNDRLDEIEEIEDDLIDVVENLDDNKSVKLMRSVIVDISLLSPFDLEDNEKTYLLAENKGDLTTISDEQLEQLRLSLSKKVKDSIRSGQTLSECPPIHWIHRLVYILVLDRKTSISDQMELIFNALDFCDIPLEKVRKKIDARINESKTIY